MRKSLTLIGAVLLSIGSVAANASVSTTVNSTCVSEQYGQHTISMEASSVYMHGERYNLRTTQKLANGSNLYIFTTQGEKPLILGLNPHSDGTTLYMVSDMNKNTLDTGTCK